MVSYAVEDMKETVEVCLLPHMHDHFEVHLSELFLAPDPFNESLSSCWSGLAVIILPAPLNGSICPVFMLHFSGSLRVPSRSWYLLCPARFPPSLYQRI